MPLDERIASRVEAMTLRRNLRRSKPRQQVIEAIFSSEEHFTAEELLERAKKIDVAISRATVYRTIALLVEEKLLHEIDLGKDHRYYDPNYLNSPDHAHLVCVDCGEVVEFEDTHLTVLRDCISARHGFKPVLHSMRIEACCEKLRREGKCPSLVNARIKKRKPN